MVCTQRRGNHVAFAIPEWTFVIGQKVRGVGAKSAADKSIASEPCINRDTMPLKTPVQHSAAFQMLPGCIGCTVVICQTSGCF